MPSEWTIPGKRPLSTATEVCGSVIAPRDRDRGYDEAVSMAYRQVAPDVPDDMVRLLARLD